MMLASNEVEGLIPFIIGIPLLFASLVLVSFFPSARGHWSGPLLAAPAFIAGILLIFVMFADGHPESLMPVVWLLFPMPLILSVSSFILYKRRKKQRYD